MEAILPSSMVTMTLVAHGHLKAVGLSGIYAVSQFGLHGGRCLALGLSKAISQRGSKGAAGNGGSSHAVYLCASGGLGAKGFQGRAADSRGFTVALGGASGDDAIFNGDRNADRTPETGSLGGVGTGPQRQRLRWGTPTGRP